MNPMIAIAEIQTILERYEPSRLQQSCATGNVVWIVDNYDEKGAVQRTTTPLVNVYRAILRCTVGMGKHLSEDQNSAVRTWLDATRSVMLKAHIPVPECDS